MGNAKTVDDLADEDHEKVCPDCASTDIDYKDGERYCRKCGLLLE